ncbi:ArsR/SmtB family transcription factor [Granulicoccus phenolivorans]|uniref:ArsR/SmtB family transcription factor n=1 Tax=Granulicoccus phenolivorans TaxID=266854 RepID=UPI000412841D|nr:helix-turn-helix domain-containing protein [Granulicoccus phenolivorans]
MHPESAQPGPAGHLAAASSASAAVGPDAQALTAALADPTRLQLLFAIHAAPGATTGVLAEAAGITPNNATKALSRLADAGILLRRVEGRYAHWRLADASVAHALLHQLGAPHTALHPPH